jgi:hypothetical protein
MTVNGATLRVHKYSSDMKAICEMRDEFIAAVKGGGHMVKMEVREEGGGVISRMECEGESFWLNRGL